VARGRVGEAEAGDRGRDADVRAAAGAGDRGGDAELRLGGGAGGRDGEAEAAWGLQVRGPPRPSESGDRTHQ
jgi:hypothetical protein